MGGPGPGRCPARLGGLCLDITDRVRVIGTATADDGGSAVLRLTVPATATDGFLATFQAAIARGPGGASSVKSNVDQGMITSSPDAPVVSDLAVVTSWFATRYNVPSNAPQGAAWTGSEYVIPHSAAAGEFAVHQQDGTWVRTFDPPGLIAPGDPAWDGAAIWVDDEFDDAIYRVDPNGAILDVLPEPTSLSSFRVALAWDGAYLWGAGSENAGRSMVFQMDPSTGEVLCAFESACLLNGLAWRDGSLWGASPYGGGGAYLCEMTPAGQTVRSVPVDLNGADSVAEGLEWDGDQFVGTGYADDGAGVRWLAIKMELP
ncbi:MAG TPA: hypothetical protein PKA64_18930 [Myxococcota bacterium]|nr:hypothetical protein [Myxococcota bacterium]